MLRLSTGARNLMFTQGFAGVFNQGSIAIYSGTQPSTADAAPTGSLLGTVGLNSATPTSETRATAPSRSLAQRAARSRTLPWVA